MGTALLLVGIQNDFFEGGSMPLDDSAVAGENAGKLLRCFRHKGIPIVHIQHISTKSELNYLRPYTLGVLPHQSVAPLKGEIFFQKTREDSFFGTNLEDYLRGINVDQLIIAGMMTHLGIDTTLRSADALGFKCILAHDACATISLNFGDVSVPAVDVHKTYISMLSSCTSARVLSTADICGLFCKASHLVQK